MKNQVGITEPTRDWFPLSLMGAFADFADLVHGPNAEMGQVSCGCHPNCGVGTAVMIDKETKEMSPVPEFLNIPGLVKDMQKITDAARGKWMSNLMMGLALLEALQPVQVAVAVYALRAVQEVRQVVWLDRQETTARSTAIAATQDIEKRRSDRWNFLFIAGMWFQDLFNYDFRRTEMCIIPLRHRKVRFPSAPTTRESAGGTSSRTCTRTRPSRSGTKSTVGTRSSPEAKNGRVEPTNSWPDLMKWT